jgi:hypothetical protein
MSTQAIDLELLRPQVYLKDGFVDEEGGLREGISGLYSLALAYDLMKEGTTVESLKSLIDEFKTLADSGLREENSHGLLDGNSFQQLGNIMNSPAVMNSKMLKDLFHAALPLLKDWPNVAGLVLHLDRAMKQLALLEVTSKQ